MNDSQAVIADKPLKILHVLRAPMGGVLRHVRDLALSHTASGHQVGIICDVPGTDGYNEAALEALDGQLKFGVTRIAMSRAPGPGDLRAVAALRARCHSVRPDVIHGHGAKGGLLARMAPVRGTDKGPVRFYAPHGGSLHFDPASLKGKLFFTTERLLQSRTEAILFVADYERRTFETKIGALTCPWQVAYNGLGPDEFEPVGLDDDPADFLFIGEVRQLKGPDVFLRALALLKDDHGLRPSAHLVGAGPDTQEMKALAADLGIADLVIFQGPMPARKAFAMARTVVMPSRAEAMPYIVLEALAAGKPLITTSVGGIPEILGTDCPSMLAPGDHEALADAMRVAIETPEDIVRGLPDLDDLQARFGLAAMTSSVMAHYRDAMAANSNVS